MATLGNTPRPAYVYDTETDTWVPVGVGAHTHDYIPNTLVDAKGDILTATADNVPARLAKGADGTVLVSDSTTSTGLAWQPYGSPHAAGKNKIINGAMEFWQRGTSFSTYNGYVADRWQTNSYSWQRDTDAPAGFTYSLAATTNPLSVWVLAYPQELLKQGSAGEINGTFTISFYAKYESGKEFYYACWFADSVGGGNQVTVSEYTGATSAGKFIGTGAWQRYSYTFNISQTPAASNLCLRHTFLNLTGATTNLFKITGVQLEAGSVATPFTRSGGTIQNELASCQRYYYRLGGDQTYQLLSYGPAHSTTRAYIPIRFPVTMRTIPSSIDWSTLALQRDPSQSIYSVTSLANLNNNGSGRDVFGLDVTIGSASLSAGTPYILITNGSTSAYLGFSAEL